MKNSYKRIEWYNFSEKVKERDNFECVECGYSKSEGAILQVHHNEYIKGRKPWEYSYDSCITLCKGCHAKHHGKIEPKKGWVLISIEDNLDRSSECDQCGTKIRYEHTIYRPNYGYKTVGSKCVEYLTSEDRGLIKRYESLVKRANSFSKKFNQGTRRWYPFKGQKNIYAHHRFDWKIKFEVIRDKRTKNPMCIIDSENNKSEIHSIYILPNASKIECQRFMFYVAEGYFSKYNGRDIDVGICRQLLKGFNYYKI